MLSVPVKMSPALLRLAYAFEFLVAWIAAFTAWSQVGGQGHLDMMAWQWKLGLPLGWAFACVRATCSAVENERAWNRSTWRWLALCAVLAAGMGAVTWYYHVNEPADEGEDESEWTAMRAPQSAAAIGNFAGASLQPVHEDGSFLLLRREDRCGFRRRVPAHDSAHRKGRPVRPQGGHAALDLRAVYGQRNPYYRAIGSDVQLPHQVSDLRLVLVLSRGKVEHHPEAVGQRSGRVR
jgi:hypothetical protein